MHNPRTSLVAAQIAIFQFFNRVKQMSNVTKLNCGWSFRLSAVIAVFLGPTISPAFGQRDLENKAAIVDLTDQIEESPLNRGLKWVAEQQRPDGS